MKNGKESFVIIEPFFIELVKQLKNFNPIICTTTLDEEFFQEFERTINELNNISDISKKTILIDFVPFLDIGGTNQFKKIAELIKDKKILIVSNSILAPSFNNNGIPTLVLDSELNIIKPPSQSEKDFGEVTNYFSLHQEYVEDVVFDLVEKSKRFPKGKYISLPDGSAVNMWFDVKKIIDNPRDLLFISYQLSYLLTRAYTKEIDEDGFIVSNNNAWALASMLSRILNKKIHIIDSLGPSPRVNSGWLQEIGRKINGSSLIIVEDLISTGREVDLLYFFLNYVGAKVKRVITLVNLERGEPIFKSIKTEEGKNCFSVLSLCRPLYKIEDYEVIPKYKLGNKIWKRRPY